MLKDKIIAISGRRRILGVGYNTGVLNIIKPATIKKGGRMGKGQ